MLDKKQLFLKQDRSRSHKVSSSTQTLITFEHMLLPKQKKAVHMCS